MYMRFHRIGSHQPPAKIEHQIAIELTNGTGTTLLDLNDDCLNEILSLISISDLCTVARTSCRLKGIANEIFQRNHKKCRFKSLVRTPLQAMRLITTFSSLIEELHLSGRQFDPEQSKNLLNLLGRCSTDSLKCLILTDVSIPVYTMSNLKTKFEDLKKLEVAARQCVFFPGRLNIIDGMTYPKLEEFKFHFCDVYAFRMFIPRHQSLKSLSISRCRPILFPKIVENCKSLEILKLFFFYPETDLEEALKKLLVLDRLKVLHIRCDALMFVTNFVRELNSMKSLETLRLQNVYTNSGFLPALSQLKNIRVLHLINCHDLVSNFDLLGEMKQLTELSIESSENVEINSVRLIERLINLKTLSLLMKTFKIDKRMYLRIVDVVNGRPERSKQSLEINCFASRFDDFDVGFHQTVELNRIAFENEYSWYHY